mgnify:CR=1 FL=1
MTRPFHLTALREKAEEPELWPREKLVEELKRAELEIERLRRRERELEREVNHWKFRKD